MNTKPSHQQTLRLDGLLTLFLIFLFLPGIFLKDFWIYNEGRRAIIAMEMLADGDWLVPHLMDEPILTKPPLFYWLEGLCYVLTGGVSDWAARLPSVFAAVACVLGLASLMRRLFDRPTAIMAALMLAPMPVFAGMAQSAEPEMLFVATAVLAMVCFVRVMEAGESSRLWRLFFYVMMLLCFLTKGPVMPLIVILTIIGYLVLSGRRSRLKEMGSWAGLAILVAPVALLITLVELRTDVVAAILQETGSHLQDDAPHEKGVYFYIDILHKLTFPWAFWIVGASLYSLGMAWKDTRSFTGPYTRLRQYLSQGSGERLLIVLWFVISIVVLSVIPSKRYYYGLALAPPAAALAAMLLRDWLATGMPLFSRLLDRFRPRVAIGFVLAAILFVVLSLFADVPEVWQEYDGKSTLDDRILLILAGVWFFGISVILWRRFGGPKGAGVFQAIMSWLAVCMVGVVACYNFGIAPEINKSLSLKQASLEIIPLIPDGSGLFSYRSTHTVCFYLGRYKLKTIGNFNNLKRYLNENPNTLCVTYGKYLDDIDEAGIGYETLYRSDYIPDKDYRVHLIRIPWPQN